MICKKCGAYNPDHATFCKVCAANLKDQTDADENDQVTEPEEVVDKELRPRRGNVKAPDFSAARRSSSFMPAQKTAEPDEEDEDDVQEPEEEEVKPARKSLFSHAAPDKKHRIADDEDDEEEDDEEDDEYDEDDSDVKKLESEPKTTRFARSSRKKNRVIEEEEDDEDEDDDEDDEEDEEDGYDDDSYDDDEEDEDDGYEEYEPTPPRRKKTSRSGNSRSGSPNIILLLVVCLLAILLIIVGIVAFCNIKGGETKAKLPRALQINCAGKQAVTQTDVPTQSTTQQDVTPTDAPVTGLPVDYSVTTLKEFIDSNGYPCISVLVTARPGDVVTAVLPNQDDYVQQNTTADDQLYDLVIPKACFFPNKPLTDSVYTVTPQILVTHADGTQESLQVDSFDITFPTIQLEIQEPAIDTIPEEGLMAAEGNIVLIKGKVDDHSVTVTVNGQTVPMYNADGTFDYSYTLSGDEAETVFIEANKNDYVSASCSFMATPYVFIPEKMPLSVVSEVNKLRADKNNKVTVTGKTVPGATLTATPAAEYTSFVACGSPTVDVEGNYSFDVTFKDYYGIASITIHAKKDGYEEGEISCIVSRMYATKDKAISGYSKAKAFYEVPTKYEYAKVMENPSADGLYRFVGKILEIDPETGVITFEAKTSYKETAKIYVLNAVAGWDATKYVGKSFKLYCTLNGLYDDGTSLYVTAWFQMKD